MVSRFISWFKRNENKFIQAGLSEIEQREHVSDKANDGSVVITEENMVNKFISWFKKNENKFIQAGLSEIEQREHVSAKADDGSILIIEENADYICQFTIRNNGVIDIEAVSKDSGELEYYIYCTVNKNVNFDNLFSNFFDYLSI